MNKRYKYRNKYKSKFDSIDKILEHTTIDPATGCMNFLGRITERGYGQIGSKLAHRLVYELVWGLVGELNVCHQCDNRKCINPHHLWLGSQKDNVIDMLNKGRGRARLSDEQVREIRTSTSLGRELSAKYGVPMSLIYNIKNGKRYTHVL